jgi:hypothetical protein
LYQEIQAAELAARMMESPYAVFYHEHVLDKEPGTEKATPWHQDQPYYPVDGDKLVRTGLGRVYTIRLPDQYLDACRPGVAGLYCQVRQGVPQVGQAQVDS